MTDAAPEFHERVGRHPAVAAAWQFDAATARSSIVAADGCFDFIAVHDKARGRCSAYVYTPVTAAHVVASAAHTRFVGVRLQPGYGAALRECGPELARRVAADGPSSVDALEAMVVDTLDAVTPPELVHEFVALARASLGEHRLTSRATGSAERELQRACQRWLGLSPKVFLRIERVWAARRKIREGHPLAAVAAELGYADQAHLSREVKQLLGVTPRALRPVGILQDRSVRRE